MTYTYEEFVSDKYIREGEIFNLAAPIECKMTDIAFAHKKSLIDKMIKPSEALEKLEEYVDSLLLKGFTVNYDEHILGQFYVHYVVKGSELELLDDKIHDDVRLCNTYRSYPRGSRFLFPSVYSIYTNFSKNNVTMSRYLRVDVFTGEVKQRYSREQILATFRSCAQNTVVLVVDGDAKTFVDDLFEKGRVQESVILPGDLKGWLYDGVEENETYRIKNDQKRMKRLEIDVGPYVLDISNMDWDHGHGNH